MKRHVLVPAAMAAVALSGVVLAAPASAGEARDYNRHTGNYTDWGPWTPAPATEGSYPACGTTVTITFPVNDEEIRTRTDSQGNQYQQVRGAFKYVLSAPDGRHSLPSDASGSTAKAGSVAYKNGAYLYDYLGDNIFADNVKGLPPHAATYGPTTVLFRADGTTRLLRAPIKSMNSCRFLDGKHHAPWS